MKPTCWKSWAGNLLSWSDLVFGPSFKVKRGQPNLKIAYNLHIIGPRGLQCETNLEKTMGWESSDVVRFDLEPLLQGSNENSQT